MKFKIQHKSLFYSLLFIFLAGHSMAQNTISGYVYEDKYRTPLDSVLVYTQSGHQSMSKQEGKYVISISGNKDSIWFNYNHKNTQKYSVDTIKNLNNFEIQIYLPKALQHAHHLPTVTVRTRSYLQDSLSLRRDYAKTFNYKKPLDALGEGVSVTPIGIGVDLDAVINLFRFGYNKRQAIYQKFALAIEQDRYIDHRYTKKLVTEITGLEGKELETYMYKYRPEYKALTLMNAIQLGKYIQITYDKYLHNKGKEKIEKNIFLPPYLQN